MGSGISVSLSILLRLSCPTRGRRCMVDGIVALEARTRSNIILDAQPLLGQDCYVALIPISISCLYVETSDPCYISRSKTGPDRASPGSTGT